MSEPRSGTLTRASCIRIMSRGERIAAIGLPEDKYDAAAISIAVLQNA